MYLYTKENKDVSITRVFECRARMESQRTKTKQTKVTSTLLYSIVLLKSYFTIQNMKTAA